MPVILRDNRADNPYYNQPGTVWQVSKWEPPYDPDQTPNPKLQVRDSSVGFSGNCVVALGTSGTGFCRVSVGSYPENPENFITMTVLEFVPGAEWVLTDKDPGFTIPQEVTGKIGSTRQFKDEFIFDVSATFAEGIQATIGGFSEEAAAAINASLSSDGFHFGIRAGANKVKDIDSQGSKTLTETSHQWYYLTGDEYNPIQSGDYSPAPVINDEIYINSLKMDDAEQLILAENIYNIFDGIINTGVYQQGVAAIEWPESLLGLTNIMHDAVKIAIEKVLEKFFNSIGNDTNKSGQYMGKEELKEVYMDFLAAVDSPQNKKLGSEKNIAEVVRDFLYINPSFQVNNEGEEF